MAPFPTASVQGAGAPETLLPRRRQPLPLKDAFRISAPILLREKGPVHECFDANISPLGFQNSENACPDRGHCGGRQTEHGEYRAFASESGIAITLLR